MNRNLLDLLACPRCRSSFVCSTTREAEGEIESGRLVCRCGAYPVIDFIPRLLDEYREPRVSSLQPPGPPEKHRDLLDRTRSSFGYQWTAFGRMSDSFKENFLNYIAPVQPSFFPGRIGLDAGCGFGRHMYYAARYGAEMVGLDASRAIDVARRNAAGRRTHFVQGDLLHPPFRDRAFDFVYCIGVLHHLPDPEAGFSALQHLAREGGPMWIWVYSKKRRVLIFLLETARRLTTHLPFPFLRVLALLAGCVDYGLFVVPARRLMRGPLEHRIPFRLKAYAPYPFQVCLADWFDRLSAPVRFYYDEADLAGWAERAGWSQYRIEATGLYGFRLQRVEEDETPCVA